MMPPVVARAIVDRSGLISKDWIRFGRVAVTRGAADGYGTGVAVASVVEGVNIGCGLEGWAGWQVVSEINVKTQNRKEIIFKLRCSLPRKIMLKNSQRRRVKSIDPLPKLITVPNL